MQKQVVSRKPRQRVPPHRGLKRYWMHFREVQEAASDATPTEGYQPSLNDDGGDDDDKDGGDGKNLGEGTQGAAASSASRQTETSEELMEDGNSVPSRTCEPPLRKERPRLPLGPNLRVVHPVHPLQWTKLFSHTDSDSRAIDVESLTTKPSPPSG